MLLQPADQCIYCFSEPDGSIEHIVPEALNGRIKLPNATCTSCKDVINQQIESPLLGYHYKRTRSARNYKSKKRGKKPEGLLPKDQGSYWKIFTKRSLPPFEVSIPFIPPEDPITYIRHYFLPPPFLVDRHPDIRREPSINMHSSAGLAYENRKMMEVKESDPYIIEIGIQSPSFVIDLLPRQLAKIACGAFFGFLRKRCHAELRDFILHGGNEEKYQKFIGSADHKYFPLNKREIKVFTVEEYGRMHLYFCMRFLPEDIDEVYFVRVGAPEGMGEVNLSFDYAA